MIGHNAYFILVDPFKCENHYKCIFFNTILRKVWILMHCKFQFYNYVSFRAIMQWNLKHMVLGVSPVMTVITMVIIGLELTSAVLLTSGLSKFCSWLMESMAEKGTELKT